MKKSILILSLLILTLLPAHAVKKIEANPINVAAMLMEMNDSLEIASTCEFYGYINLPSQDNYTVFNHPNGSIIRYSFQSADNGKKYPTVEVKSKTTPKGKDKILKDLNFQKIGNAYERRAIKTVTLCSNNPQGFLIFQKIPK